MITSIQVSASKCSSATSAKPPPATKPKRKHVGRDTRSGGGLRRTCATGAVLLVVETVVMRRDGIALGVADMDLARRDMAAVRLTVRRLGIRRELIADASGGDRGTGDPRG